MKRGRIALAVVLPLLILLAGRIGAYREKDAAGSASSPVAVRAAVLDAAGFPPRRGAGRRANGARPRSRDR
jgi:hypothetical protein